METSMDQKVTQIMQLKTMYDKIETGDVSFEFKWENVGYLTVWTVEPGVGPKAEKHTLNRPAVQKVIVDLINDGPTEFAEIVQFKCQQRIDQLKKELTEEFSETMRRC